jgi:hypothetical protein
MTVLNGPRRLHVPASHRGQVFAGDGRALPGDGWTISTIELQKILAVSVLVCVIFLSCMSDVSRHTEEPAYAGGNQQVTLNVMLKGPVTYWFWHPTLPEYVRESLV